MAFPNIAPHTFENQNEALEVKLLETIPEEFEETKNRLKGRLNELHRVMKEAGIGQRELHGAVQTVYKEAWEK